MHCILCYLDIRISILLTEKQSLSNSWQGSLVSLLHLSHWFVLHLSYLFALHLSSLICNINKDIST